MVACTSQVYRLNAAGGVMQTYTAAALGESSPFFALNLDPDGTSFWTGGYSTGNIYRVDIASGPPAITSFTAPPVVFSMAGLAIFGEPTVSRPTLPGPPVVGGIAGLLDDGSAPAEESGSSSADYGLPLIAAAAAGALIAMAAGGWYARRLLQKRVRF